MESQPSSPPSPCLLSPPSDVLILSFPSFAVSSSDLAVPSLSPPPSPSFSALLKTMPPPPHSALTRALSALFALLQCLTAGGSSCFLSRHSYVQLAALEEGERRSRGGAGLSGGGVSTVQGSWEVGGSTEGRQATPYNARGARRGHPPHLIPY